MRKMGLLLAVAICALAATSLAGAAGTVSPPVQVTDDQFAANEESLGMDPSGQVMLGMWNDWHYNDGCGISYSTDGGSHWAPESFAPFTAFTNDPNVPGTGTFAIAGDPVVVYNPKSGLFDVICQAFGAPAHQIQLLSTTFDVTKANPSLTNSSYGLSAWRLPTVAITTGTSNGSQKGSNGKFPDHEAGTVDTGTGAGHHFGRLYVAWAEFNGKGQVADRSCVLGQRRSDLDRPDPRQRRRPPVRPGRDAARRARRNRLRLVHERTEREEHEGQLGDDRQVDRRRQHVEPELRRRSDPVAGDEPAERAVPRRHRRDVDGRPADGEGRPRLQRHVERRAQRLGDAHSRRGRPLVVHAGDSA